MSDSPKKLKPKEKLFIRGYCGPFKFNGTQAAIAAGYSESCAAVYAHELLRKPNIKVEIEKRLQEQAFEYDELTRKIISEYQKIAFSDYTKLADFDGFIAKYKSVDEIPEDLKVCIKKIKMTDSSVEVELYSKEKALADLAKITGLTVETKRVVGEDYETLIERLTRKSNEE